MNIYENNVILIYFTVLFFILGTVFGSFLNCVAERIKNHEKWWTGSSHCDSCGHKLGILDLFPIISFIILKGKCRYCGAKLSIKYFLSELLLGILYVFFLFIYKTIDIELVFYLGLITCLYGLSLCDLNTYEIPDGFISVGIILWVLLQIIQGINILDVLMQIISSIAVSGSVLLISILMDKILKKESIGGGDIKLLFVVGLYLPLLVNILNLIISCIIGLAFIVIKREDKIPFGPAISLASYLSLLFGKGIVSWYIKLLMF